MAAQWYAARTQPRAESLSASQLERDGIEVFCPRFALANPKAGNQDTPLFPGYLFVRLDLQNSGWPIIHPAHHLLGWVRFGGEPACLPDDVVSDLMERVATINDSGGLWQHFYPGQKVRVIINNMDTLGEVLEGAKTARGRAKVLMQFMGRLIQATVPYGSLRPVETAPQQNSAPHRRTRGGRRWVKGFKPATAVT